jgi:hypothetical protein
MTLEDMTEIARDHFIANLITEVTKMIVFHHYASEELDLPPDQMADFIIKTQIGERDDLFNDEDRFYTWYYVNYVVPVPAATPSFNFQ